MGILEGMLVGCKDGLALGDEDGTFVGVNDGIIDGIDDGHLLGIAVVGIDDGMLDGVTEGIDVGRTEGSLDGYEMQLLNEVDPRLRVVGSDKGHVTQDVDPVVDPYCPIEHRGQYDSPVVGEYWPMLQLLQVVAPV